VFADVALQDNLDGEALLWAAQRLAARPEKTKLLISISDGLPQAHLGNTAELDRHLLTACKTIEAKKPDGMILFGIGGAGEAFLQKRRSVGVRLRAAEDCVQNRRADSCPPPPRFSSQFSMTVSATAMVGQMFV
jgi:hypothetical protein